jgi:hypothetical protein
MGLVFRDLVTFALIVAPAATQLILDFNASEVIHEVDASYINYNIDTGSLYNGMDFQDKKFRALTAQLGPAYIRIGRFAQPVNG